jgi:hypothetical protein
MLPFLVQKLGENIIQRSGVDVWYTNKQGVRAGAAIAKVLQPGRNVQKSYGFRGIDQWTAFRFSAYIFDNLFG